MRAIHRVWAICVMMLAGTSATANPLLNEIFTDHAVLQRDRAVEIWGTANASEQLTVTIAGQSVVTVADSEGNWRVRLLPMKAGGPHQLSVTNKAGETQTLNDVLIGDVYLCSGQSNMEMQVKASMNAEGEIRRAQCPANPAVQCRARECAAAACDIGDCGCMEDRNARKCRRVFRRVFLFRARVAAACGRSYRADQCGMGWLGD